jgi:hypothetical protein
MINVLALKAVDRGFEPQSGHSNDDTITICCFSAKHNGNKEKEQTLVGSESG